MRPVMLYSVVTLGVIGLSAWALALAFSRAGSSEAIGLSALVAIVVQVGAFSATRLMAPRNVVAAWGAGSLVRHQTLVVYALLVVKVLGLPAAPALLSLTLFFFLSTLLEPLFLRR
jgi:hypothetical protein